MTSFCFELGRWSRWVGGDGTRVAGQRRGGDEQRSLSDRDHAISTAPRSVDDPHSDPRTVGEGDAVDEFWSGKHPEVLVHDLRPSLWKPMWCGVWSHQEDILMLQGEGLQEGALSRVPLTPRRGHGTGVLGGKMSVAFFFRAQTSPRVSALDARQSVRRPLRGPRRARGNQVDPIRV